MVNVNFSKSLAKMKIGEKAFFNCTSLKEVNIPKNLKPTIGSDAFKNCPVKVMFGYEEEEEDDYDYD